MRRNTLHNDLVDFKDYLFEPWFFLIGKSKQFDIFSNCLEEWQLCGSGTVKLGANFIHNMAHLKSANL